MTEQTVVSPELAAELDFQPGCEIGHRGHSVYPPCPTPAAWVIRLGHECPGSPALFFVCQRHMTEIARACNQPIGHAHCPACHWTTTVLREAYLSWTRL